MRFSTGNERMLNIRFDNYGAADDDEFKYELILLMAGSLRELKSAAEHCHTTRDSDHFRKAVHKAKSTLTLIDEQDLWRVVDEYSAFLGGAGSNGIAAKNFNEVCDSMIASLYREAERIKASF